MIEGSEIDFNKPVKRRTLLKVGVGLAFGLPVAGMAAQEIERAFNHTEINRDNMPQAVQQHYDIESLLTEGVILPPEIPTQTPDIWRASSVSFWSGENVSGGAVVEYSPNKYCLMTTTESLEQLKTTDQAYIFIPGLEIDDVANAKQWPLSLPNPIPDTDSAAFKSKAFRKVHVGKFQPIGNTPVVVLPLSEDMSQAMQQAKIKGYIKPLQLVQQPSQNGDLVGGARFNRGTDTKYKIASGIISWVNPQFNDPVDTWTSIREDDSHFPAGRFGDAVVTLNQDGSLTPQLTGFVSKTLDTTSYTRGKSYSPNVFTAARSQVIKAPLMK